ncbi:extensin-like [Hibiscus syriacus]|uniref:extensin-like n=1 Tax=Hibiscus syriacus TaxID=106335 RepID=UPI00192353DD|nr:extensin-like [Hibiscus syriacus]
MSTPTSIFKLSLPLNSFKLNITKLPISLKTTNSNSTKLSPPSWRRILAERSFGAPSEVPSRPNYTSPSPDVLEIVGTSEMDPSDSDPPPLSRPTPDTGPDFSKPPLGPPPTGPKVVPIPPSPPPSREPPPEVNPPSTPPDYVSPPSVPPKIPKLGIPPEVLVGK